MLRENHVVTPFSKSALCFLRRFYLDKLYGDIKVYTFKSVLTNLELLSK